MEANDRATGVIA